MSSKVTFRTEPVAADRDEVRAIVQATDKFSAEEVDIAVELVDDRLTKGARSDYAFLFAERDGTLVGYACFGSIAGTAASYDLYWIAVDPRCQGQGVGKVILRASEAAIRALGGERVYIDTSSRPDYRPTRAFYEACGYHCAAVLDDFYRKGDGKAIYCRVVGASGDELPRD